MPESPAIRAALCQENPQRIYPDDLDDDHKSIKLLVTNVGQKVIIRRSRA
jgi:hypothetical protein